jgi:hypothetical protein
MKIQNEVYIELCLILRTEGSEHLAAASQDSKTIWLAHTEPIVAVCHFHLLNYRRNLEQLRNGRLKGGEGAFSSFGSILLPYNTLFL